MTRQQGEDAEDLVFDPPQNRPYIAEQTASITESSPFSTSTLHNLIEKCSEC